MNGPMNLGSVIDLNITSEIFFSLKLLLVTIYLEVLAYSREHLKV
jgi:hypothetical protein